MSRSKKPLMLLTLRRRARVAKILASCDWSSGINAKATVVSRQLGEPCTFGQALSLIGQFKRSARSSKSDARVNDERFQKMKAQRTDLY